MGHRDETPEEREDRYARNGRRILKWAARVERRYRVKYRQVEGVSYGQPQLIHKGGKP